VSIYELLLLQPEPAAKKSNWRQKHEDFVRTIRAARGVQAAMDRGEPLPPPPPPSINPGPQIIFYVELGASITHRVAFIK